MKHELFMDVPPEKLEDTIERWIRGRHCLRNRQILKDRLLKGFTFEHLAEVHDMSVRRVKDIVYDGELTISKYL